MPRTTSTVGPERSSSVRQAVTSPSKTFFSLPGTPSSIFTSLHSAKVGLPCHLRSWSETTSSKALAPNRVWKTRMPMMAAAVSPVSFVPSRVTANSGFIREVSGTGGVPRAKQILAFLNYTLFGKALEAPPGKSERFSTCDHERAELALRRAPADFDIFDPGSGRAAAAPGDEFLDALFRTLDDGLDFAAGEVADLALEAEPLRFLPGAGAVEDALDTALRKRS